MEYCCICRKALPNRYAVAGRCQDASGCEAPFCMLCWRHGNQRCSAHGGQQRDVPEESAPVAEKVQLVEPPASTDDQAAAAAKPGRVATAAAAAGKLTRDKAVRVMQWTVDAVSKLGRRAVALAGRLRQDHSPEAMIATLDASLEALVPKRERTAAELEALYNRIAAGKQELASAPPARQRILQAELTAQLAQYRGLERQYRILLDNERHVHTVRNRLQEMTLYGMAAVDEKLVDVVTDDIDEAADEAEGREDAIRDLERAGKRRDQDSDPATLLQQLDEFALPTSEPTVAAAEPAAQAEESQAPLPPLAESDFDLPAPPAPPATDGTAQQRQQGEEPDGISQ
ncbi:MAG: hypothetical protein BWX73_00430 [Lentisphaerae bacterium ADurb.Bin082]|nr:MAG: hypothetical protein BWX73_00430 [Lentisphaerae bacterium ADurb.Bin082]